MTSFVVNAKHLAGPRSTRVDFQHRQPCGSRAPSTPSVSFGWREINKVLEAASDSFGELDYTVDSLNRGRG